MSNKRILNLTARKKRDTMLIYTNTTIANPSGSSTYTAADALLKANVAYVFPWVATWRESDAGTTVVDQSSRTATTCFMRGLKETIRCSTSDGTSWLWRRVAFTIKGDEFFDAASAGFTLAVNTSQGIRRVVNNVNAAPLGVAIEDMLFRGQRGIDWGSYFTAPLDNTRVTIKMDRTTNITSGNQVGKNKVVNFWHPMNKNLRYNDDEVGPGHATSGRSTVGKQGMGDYYVVDFITSGTPQSTDSGMSFTPEATLYWHEK